VSPWSGPFTGVGRLGFPRHSLAWPAEPGVPHPFVPRTWRPAGSGPFLFAGTTRRFLSPARAAVDGQARSLTDFWGGRRTILVRPFCLPHGQLDPPCRGEAQRQWNIRLAKQDITAGGIRLTIGRSRSGSRRRLPRSIEMPVCDIHQVREAAGDTTGIPDDWARPLIDNHVPATD